MKLANKAFLLTLVMLMLAFAATGQSGRSENDPRNSAPTVGTGGPTGGPTGLFTVYDGWTLRRGEYTLSIAYSNYDRDPGNVDITSVPVSFQVGLSNRFELFFTTEAWRGVKVNSPRNLSGFYLPNSTVVINGVRTTAPAIILAPSGPGSGPLVGRAIYRPTGLQPFANFPYIGGSSGTFGFVPPFFAGPQFGFPANTNPTMGPPRAGGVAATFPGIGSTVGGLLPGIVLQTVNLGGTCATSTAGACQGPAVFTVAPSYQPEMPFLNRTWGQSSFNSLDFGFKWRFNHSLSAIGYGIVAYYRWWQDTGGSFAGFNQLQRGAGPGGNKGDIHLSFFTDVRFASWGNLSGNVGYTYTSKAEGKFGNTDFVMLDRPDEVNAGIALDFPVNKYFQPILELKSTRYVGGRTPNAFERNPLDGIAGFRIFPRRWFGFGFAYRHNFNEQDEDSFDDDQRSTSVLVSCLPGQTACTPQTITTSWRGVPPGFVPSRDPHGYIGQFWIGRRDSRQGPIENKPPSVDSVTLSDTVITLPCPPGMNPRSGTCNDSRSISVQTRASDPENDVLTYNYTVSGGRIVGTGANVTWDLTGVGPGSYTITTGVDDGCGVCGKTDTQTIRIENCDCVAPPRACSCPTLSVSGPAGITRPGDSMTFTANVSGGSQEGPITYNWTVSAGTIVSGQGTPSITVATTREMRNSNVTATVSIGGTDPACNCQKEASDTGGIADLPQARQIDEFGKKTDDEVKAIIDGLYTQLANDPTATGYIINYGTPAQIRARRAQIMKAINFRKYDPSRVTFVDGPDQGSGILTKIYIVPPGADNPQP
jgi:hypothetical protein